MSHFNCLLVEDNPVLEKNFIRALNSHYFNVDLAHTFQHCLMLLQERKSLNEKYDLLLLDLCLPGINPLTIVEECKNISKEVPLIILASPVFEKEAKQAVANGAIEYIRKTPGMDLECLILRLTDIIERSKAGFNHNTLLNKIQTVSNRLLKDFTESYVF